MNYVYELSYNCIIEGKDYLHSYMNIWYIDQLKKHPGPLMRKDMESFKRTKKWLFENYPELLI
jgi:hypothetical protein